MTGTAHAAPASGPVPDVGAYAALVRAHLTGLPQDQVDDLTDGLEADLADALADESRLAAGSDVADLRARFGDPRDYARELRLAAGLPEPADEGPDLRSPAQRAWARVRAGLERMGSELGAQPWWPPLRDFLVSLRPVWWLARAWVVYQVIAFVLGLRQGWLPRDPVTMLVLAVLAVVSVQWGRGRWVPRRGRVLPVLVSGVAAVLLVPVVAVASDSEVTRMQYSTQYVETQPQDGVWVDGMQVSNLFVYDAEGNALTDVQVYDDRGRPVRTVTDGGWGWWSLPGVAGEWSFLPVQDEDGRERWNVYPLRGAPSTEFDWERGDGSESTTGELLTTEPQMPPRPFAKAPAIVDDAAADAEGTTDEQAADQPADQDERPAPDPSGSPEPGPTATP